MSSSKSSSSQQQSTTQQGIEGSIGSTILQGGSISYTEEFPQGVQDSFQDLIELAQGGLSFAAGAGQAAVDVVADTRFRSEQPLLSTQEKLIPWAIGAAALVAVVLLIRKR